MFTVQPIGYFHSTAQSFYEVPRQGALNTGNQGVIELNSGCQYEQALEGLEGFDRIWVLFCFHRNRNWKPKVLPPRGGHKQGVFATRSPHRPNPIGLSCVELQAIKGLKLFVVNHDLIDGTPIIDIKPYINYADAFHCQRQGWLEELGPEPIYVMEWSRLAEDQCDYLENMWTLSLKEPIENRLKASPLPYANNRVKEVAKGQYELALRTWRIYYHIDGDHLVIDQLSSGYDAETLAGLKPSKWDDVPIHQEFMKRFSEETL